MFYWVLMDVIQSRQPGFLERQMSIPEFIYHPTHRQLSMKMSDEITMRDVGIFEANHEVIVIGKKRPSLQNKRVVFRELESYIAQKIQLYA